MSTGKKETNPPAGATPPEQSPDALDAMLAAPDQGKRMTILRKAINAVSETKHPKQAAGGFAVCMVNVIERGLEAISHDRL